jgi:hypothetical protein
MINLIVQQPKQLLLPVPKQPYTSRLVEYSERFNISIEEIMSSPILEHRYFGYRYTPEIRQKRMHLIPKQSITESVLIEFRILPNLEFVLRNTILKLPHSWAHTIVCGTYNYSTLLKIARKISPNIRVIKLPPKNLQVDEYSTLLTTSSFWEMFYGEKLLIYQEDSCVFKSYISNSHPDMKKFLQYDYVGAPWPKPYRVTRVNSGNGGFSLRTKSIMIQILEKAQKENHTTIPSPHVYAYMKKQKLNVIPEDNTIVGLMLDFKIGRIADYTTASYFSSETIWNPHSFGGHKFWTSVASKIWRERLYNDIIAHF